MRETVIESKGWETSILINMLYNGELLGLVQRHRLNPSKGLTWRHSDNVDGSFNSKVSLNESHTSERACLSDGN